MTAEDIHEMVNAETWLTGEEATLLFNVGLTEPVKALNCTNFIDKLKALGAKKIPRSLSFSDKEKRVSTLGRRKDLKSKMIQVLRGY